MDGSAVGRCLDLLDSQRREVLRRLDGIAEKHLWWRPEPDAWSIGENLDHARLAGRTFRRFLKGLWPLLKLTAWPVRRRPYPTKIDDVYERPGFPLSVGWVWSPRYTPARPAPLATLATNLEAEHNRMRAFYAGKDEHLLGHAWLWGPAMGAVNMIQALRVVAYHDAHHYRTVEERLRALDVAQEQRI